MTYSTSISLVLEQMFQLQTGFVLSGMDKGMHTGVISTDLQRALHTLNHKIVLERMTLLLHIISN